MARKGEHCEPLGVVFRGFDLRLAHANCRIEGNRINRCRHVSVHSIQICRAALLGTSTAARPHYPNLALRAQHALVASLTSNSRLSCDRLVNFPTIACATSDRLFLQAARLMPSRTGYRASPSDCVVCPICQNIHIRFTEGSQCCAYPLLVSKPISKHPERRGVCCGKPQMLSYLGEAMPSRRHPRSNPQGEKSIRGTGTFR